MCLLAWSVKLRLCSLPVRAMMKIQDFLCVPNAVHFLRMHMRRRILRIHLCCSEACKSRGPERRVRTKASHMRTSPVHFRLHMGRVEETSKNMSVCVRVVERQKGHYIIHGVTPKIKAAPVPRCDNRAYHLRADSSSSSIYKRRQQNDTSTTTRWDTHVDVGRTSMKTTTKHKKRAATSPISFSW